MPRGYSERAQLPQQDKAAKELPTRVVPVQAMVGHDTLVITDGPSTYQIDLQALFATGVGAALSTAWRQYHAHTEEGQQVRQRLSAMGL